MKGGYADALSRLYGLTRFGEKLSLDGPRAFHAHLGYPLSMYRSVLVGGTNGKGSTCAFLEATLRHAGLRTGLFTSPHLNSFVERIRIEGQPIDPEWIARNAGRAVDWADAQGGSFFEAVWGMAACAFAEAEVDVAIWEVGLGGRLDATNVADPEVSAITSIGLDHTHVLGDTLEAIAQEKSAIYRACRPALTGATGAGLDALRAVYPAEIRHVEALDGVVELSLPGAHQRRNAALALAIAEALGHPVAPDVLADVVWPGRAEVIDDVTLDCAHNPQAIDALLDWLSGCTDRPYQVIFGAMQGKDIQGMAQRLEGWADDITLVTPDYLRRVEALDLARCFRGPVKIIESVGEALDGRCGLDARR